MCSIVLKLCGVVLTVCFGGSLDVVLFVLSLILCVLLSVNFVVVGLGGSGGNVVGGLRLKVYSIFIILTLNVICFGLGRVCSDMVVLSNVVVILSAPFRRTESL